MGLEFLEFHHKLSRLSIMPPRQCIKALLDHGEPSAKSGLDRLRQQDRFMMGLRDAA